MKKVILAVVVGGAFLVSCKKDYTCTCTYENQVLEIFQYTKVSKDDATKNCNKEETLWVASGYPEVNCNVK
jgi:hypothetical protein